MWQKLVEIVSRETKTELSEIILLRHSDNQIEKLKEFGGSIEDYTAVQAIDSKYDFAATEQPLIRLVVVIVQDRIFGVYAISGILAQGSNRELESDEVNRMHEELGRPVLPARKFLLTKVVTSIIGNRIRGWKGKERTSVARAGSSVFLEIEVETEEQKSAPVYSDDILRNTLTKDFRKFPKPIREIYFLLYDWLNDYNLKKVRSKNRDGSWGSTVSFKLNGTEFCGLQISPAGDIHFRFNQQKFEAAGVFPELKHAILKEIQPFSNGKLQGTGNNVTSTGIKIILTAGDAKLFDLIIEQLSPLVGTVCGHSHKTG